MKFNLYSVYDRTMAIYLSPFPARNSVEAVRNIKASFDDPQFKSTPVGKSPADFDLVHIGHFDDESGEITRLNPTIMANIGDLAASTVPS